MSMAFRTLAALAAVFVLAACGGGGIAVRGGPSSPEKITFASVPGNIIDAPVPRAEWRSVSKRVHIDRTHISTWTATFNGGRVQVLKAAHAFHGREFYSESSIRKLATKRGLTRVAALEWLGNAVSNWGWMGDATWGTKRCVVGAFLTESPRFKYAGFAGGDIIGAFRDCRDDAGARRADWRLWLQGFKAVGPSYNMLLDR